MTNHETREDSQNLNTFAEVAVAPSPEISGLQREIGKSNPAFIPQPRENLHITLGNYNRKGEVFTRIESIKKVDPSVFSDVYENFLMQAGDIVKNSGTALATHIELFGKTSIVLTFKPDSMLITARSATFELFMYMLMACGLTEEESRKIMTEDAVLQYMLPGNSRAHLTLGNCPPETILVLPRIKPFAISYSPSYIKKRP